MPKARDVMHKDAECIRKDKTLAQAAKIMQERDIGAMPICDENDRLCGMLTDRDIVVKCVAPGKDPSKVRAGDLAQGTPRWISADADVSEVVREMSRNQIKRLPVIDQNKNLVGIISERELGHHLSKEQIADFVEHVYA